MQTAIKTSTIPTIPKTNNLSSLSLEEKINKVLSIFESIEIINDYTVVKLNPNVVICTDSDLVLASGKNISIKTVNGNLYLN